MSTDDTIRCIYCNDQHELLPLPYQCPACGMTLGQTIHIGTTFADIVGIVARSNRRVHLDVAPGLGKPGAVPGVLGVLFEVEGGGGWASYVHADGSPVTDADVFPEAPEDMIEHEPLVMTWGAKKEEGTDTALINEALYHLSLVDNALGEDPAPGPRATALAEATRLLRQILNR